MRKEFHSSELDTAYLTFISIVFGVFISVWVVPYEEIVTFTTTARLEKPELAYMSRDSLDSMQAILKNINIKLTQIDTPETSKDGLNISEEETKAKYVAVVLTSGDYDAQRDRDQFKVIVERFKVYVNKFIALQSFQGTLMFFIMICLWWWYGIFLGRVRPAQGLVLYAYDFVSLGAFAIAFRFWNHEFLYPVSVVMAGILVLIRLMRAAKHLNPKTPEWLALHVGVYVLGAFVVIIPVLLILSGIEVIPPKYHSKVIPLSVMTFHVCAIAATIFAAVKLKVFRVKATVATTPSN